MRVRENDRKKYLFIFKTLYASKVSNDIINERL